MYLAALPNENVLETADATLPTFCAVLAPNPTTLAPPVGAAVIPAPIAITTSSTATLAIIPKVYPEFNNKLFVQAILPSLEELPIAIASSNSLADS